MAASAVADTADDADLPLTQLYWGDTHLHTSNSPDASMNGNIRIGPAEAYRFARGEAILAHNGQQAKLKRPLDFLVVADHAEYFGLLPRIRAADEEALRNKVLRRWADMIGSGDKDKSWQAMFEMLDDIEKNQPSVDDEDILRTAWHAFAEVADQHDRPGEFSALIGYEWTSMPGGSNLHRVVVFGDGADKASRVLPFSSFDSEDPEDLWAHLAHYEKHYGGNVIAIPHNGNLSNGRMFAPTDFSGDPIDRQYAEQRARWEPLVEVTQIKGDSETHPALSPDDSFADFETWDYGNLTASKGKEPWMLQYEYARSALLHGLGIRQAIGVNPYRFGMIGSSDAHTGFAAVAEDNFWGKFSVYEPGLGRLTEKPVSKGKLGKAYDLWAYEMVASGYTGVWATANTREAILAAMKRREVYATTGPRIVARMFGGWEFDSADLAGQRIDIAGYGKGVPMGSDLGSAPAGASPGFLVQAAMDPDSVKLARLQIVKGWLDNDGSQRERVYDVVISTEGSAEITEFWHDPDFDASYPAFYYVRVLEVPKPRWTSSEAARLETPFRGRVPYEIQDRAYTSPIWYVPRPERREEQASRHGG